VSPWWLLVIPGAMVLTAFVTYAAFLYYVSKDWWRW